jgi:hypothetical protein
MSQFLFDLFVRYIYFEGSSYVLILIWNQGIGGGAVRLGEAQASPELEKSRLGETELYLHFF